MLRGISIKILNEHYKNKEITLRVGLISIFKISKKAELKIEAELRIKAESKIGAESKIRAKSWRKADPFRTIVEFTIKAELTYLIKQLTMLRHLISEQPKSHLLQNLLPKPILT